MPWSDRADRLQYHKVYNKLHYLEAKKKRQSPFGRARALFSVAKTRAKRSGIKFSLDVAHIQEVIEAGICEVTKIPFVLEVENGRSPWAPSLDRKDSKQGYTPENTQVVVTIYNLAKAEFTHEDVIEFARLVRVNCGNQDI